MNVSFLYMNLNVLGLVSDLLLLMLLVQLVGEIRKMPMPN